VTAPSTGLASARHDAATWARAHDTLVGDLRDLIRIPSINPPDPPGAELQAARAIADRLRDVGIVPEVLEPFPGRGSVIARLRGDGTGGDPLLLLSHLDVVPAPAERWTHDPFAGDVADGYVWGRGAVDMKGMVALELGVLRLLAAEARAAGRDPGSDPIPGLRRDVLFACTADEEAGGHQGAGWLVANRPETLRAAGALNECGGVSMEVAGRRFYPIGVAEKGFVVYRLTITGTWGHGSMPRDDNAAVRAATAIARLAVPGTPRLTGPMREFFAAAAASLDGPQAELLRAITGEDAGRSEAALRSLCDPALARATRALLRDTISPDVVHAGVKYNVIPGEAIVEIDCRILPGMTEEAMRAEVVRRLGDLVEHIDVALVIAAKPVEAPTSTPLYQLMADTIRAHDPEAVPVPAMVPFATDAKHTVNLDVPTYGFSPLRNEPGERFLERFHGVDERVSVDALRWGLPVIYDVVTGFCG
jgi:acetylornithine deacetylase/succinyl-diaminopimelate desuccinylase-like protein